MSLSTDIQLSPGTLPMAGAAKRGQGTASEAFTELLGAAPAQPPKQPAHGAAMQAPGQAAAQQVSERPQKNHARPLPAPAPIEDDPVQDAPAAWLNAGTQTPSTPAPAGSETAAPVQASAMPGVNSEPEATQTPPQPPSKATPETTATAAAAQAISDAAPSADVKRAQAAKSADVQKSEVLQPGQSPQGTQASPAVASVEPDDTPAPQARPSEEAAVGSQLRPAAASSEQTANGETSTENSNRKSERAGQVAEPASAHGRTVSDRADLATGFAARRDSDRSGAPVIDRGEVIAERSRARAEPGAAIKAPPADAKAVAQPAAAQSATPVSQPGTDLEIPARTPAARGEESAPLRAPGEQVRERAAELRGALRSAEKAGETPPAETAKSASPVPAASNGSAAPSALASTPALDPAKGGLPGDLAALAPDPVSDPAAGDQEFSLDGLRIERAERGAEMARAANAQPHTARMLPAQVQTLAARIAQRFNEGTRVFDIRIDPPELGRVDVRLEMGRDNRVNAILTAERPEALAELQRSARDLEKSLIEAGLDLGEDGLSFELADQGASDGQSGEEPAYGRQFALPAEHAVHDITESARMVAHDIYGFAVAARARLDMSA